MKRCMIIFLIFVVLLSFCGCNIGVSSSETVGSLNEPLNSADNLETSTPAPQESNQTLVPVQSETEKSPQKSPGSMKWPAGFLPNLPEPRGEISSLFIDDTKIEGYFEEPQFLRMEIVNMEEKDADEFINGLKAGGYDENAVYEKNGHLIKYYAQDYPALEKGNRVIFKWKRDDRKATVALLKPGDAALEWYLMDYFDDTGEEDLSPWPVNFIPNFPEPKGKIVNVDKTYVNNEVGSSDTVDVDFYCADRQSVMDCIAEMKKRYYIEAFEQYEEKEIEYGGLSEFFGEGYFDDAYIFYENYRHESIVKDHRGDNRFHTITVSMSKAR